MDAKEFVLLVRDERDSLLASYTAPVPTTLVGKLIQEAGLTPSQREQVVAAIDQALTDAFYTLLLGLDGSASIGGVQQGYRIQDEAGSTISRGDGELEELAFEAFQNG